MSKNGYEGFEIKQGQVIDKLKQICRWVCWDWEERNGRMIKPPKDWRDGSRASVSDPRTWGSYDEVTGAAQSLKISGIGIVLTGKENIIAIDLDDVFDGAGRCLPWVQELLDRNETYAEISPSGRGIRMIAEGTLDKAVVDHAAGVEIYSDGRYVTITGNRVDGAPDKIGPATSLIESLSHRVLLSGTKRRKVLDAERHKITMKSGDGVSDGKSLFRFVNDAALENLSAWVEELFPCARPMPQGYRVSSFDLGRDLEEDLSITSAGIKDFGVADLGDEKDGCRTAIDLVIEHSESIGIDTGVIEGLQSEAERKRVNGKNAIKACMWLAQRLGIDVVKSSRYDTDESTLLTAMNEKFCVVMNGGRAQVVSFEKRRVGYFDRFETVSTSFDEFRKFYQNRFVAVKNETETVKGNALSQKTSVDFKPLGKWWLDHPERRTYEGIICEPNSPQIVGNKLNTWRGFAVELIPGDWSKMQAHITSVLADGDTICSEYLLNWLALAVQKPGRQIGVAVVLLGGKGTGKSIVVNAFRKIFGQHGIQLSNINQVVGNFNYHLMDTCLLFCDEAYWGGDKINDGQLKRLITEPDIAIEQKHKDTIFVTNMLKVMMASNERWAVPATANERRYFVLQVSEEKQGDHGWFDAILKEQNDGGIEAMLYDLLRRDLSNFNVRSVPATKALLQQQQEGLTGLDSWLHGILNDGSVPYSGVDDPSFSYSEALFKNFNESQVGSKNYATQTKLVQYLKSKGCVGKRQSDNRRGLVFPPLSVMRRDWASKYPGTEWDDDDVSDWITDPIGMHETGGEYLSRNGIKS